jgi:high-affinity iron transporter
MTAHCDLTGDGLATVVRMGSVFVQAAVILLREGLEALLVLAALTAYLIKADARDRLPALYTGAILALLASLAAAWVFQVFNNGMHSDLFEAFVILAAAALMLYVSGWLLLRQDPKAWQHYLKSKADAALARRTGIAVGTLAFLAVFREGAETVLFVYALAKTSGGFSLELIAGLIAAALGLVVLFFVINIVAKRVPLRPLFIVTSAFLFLMAVKMIGDATMEFQEQQVFSYTPIDSGGVLEALGLNPTVEAVSAQVFVMVLAVCTFVVLDRRGRGANAQQAGTRA